MTSHAKPSKSLRSSRKAKRRSGSVSTGRPVRQVALAEVKDDLSRFLRLAASQEILITRHGRPAGVLIGFETEGGLVRLSLGASSRIRSSNRGGAGRHSEWAGCST
jgi:prevent-host-death family protein